MSTPRKGKKVATFSECLSPKNFRCSNAMDDVLLDLLLNEVNKGNRPDQTFSALAYRNIVNRFNELHGTNINKDNVKNRIRTLKSTFDVTYNNLSGEVPSGGQFSTFPDSSFEGNEGLCSAPLNPCSQEDHPAEAEAESESVGERFSLPPLAIELGGANGFVVTTGFCFTS